MVSLSKASKAVSKTVPKFPIGLLVLILRHFFQDKPKFPLADVDKASKYLASKTFESLNEMFTASQQIQVQTCSKSRPR